MAPSNAPCNANGQDPNYPNPDGSIGAWGYDFLEQSLVNPLTFDLMTYCNPKWIGDYYFTKALRHRQFQVQVTPIATTCAVQRLRHGRLKRARRQFLQTTRQRISWCCLAAEFRRPQPGGSKRTHVIA